MISHTHLPYGLAPTAVATNATAVWPLVMHYEYFLPVLRTPPATRPRRGWLVTPNANDRMLPIIPVRRLSHINACTTRTILLLHASMRHIDSMLNI